MVTTVEAAPDKDSIVIRFRPVTPETLVKKAATAARRSDGPGLHTASVWCLTPDSGEDPADAVVRLLEITVQNGLSVDSNGVLWFCARAGDLLDRGFRFVKDGYRGEPPEHYSVVLGNPPTEDDARRFVEPFSRMKR